jgi:hypothetical protein
MKKLSAPGHPSHHLKATARETPSQTTELSQPTGLSETEINCCEDFSRQNTKKQPPNAFVINQVDFLHFPLEVFYSLE